MFILWRKYEKSLVDIPFNIVEYFMNSTYLIIPWNDNYSKVHTTSLTGSTEACAWISAMNVRMNPTILPVEPLKQPQSVAEKSRKKQFCCINSMNIDHNMVRLQHTIDRRFS